jgi:AAHS family benzoate transporter-like MFS transporter
MRAVNVSQMIADSKFNRFFAIVFVLCCAVLVCDGYDQGIYGAAMPLMMKDTGIGAATFGLIGSYTLYGMMFGGLFFGFLADRVGRKRMIQVSVACYSLGAGLFGLSYTPLQFGLCRVLTGFGLGGIVPITIAMLTEYAPRSKRSTMVIISTLSVPVGTSLSALAGVFILPAFGWRAMFLLGCVPVLGILVLQAYMPESMEHLVKHTDNPKIRQILARSTPDYIASPEDDYITDYKSKSNAPVSNLFKNGFAFITVLFWIMFGCVMLSGYFMAVWMPKLMTQMGFPLKSSLFFMFTYYFGCVPALFIAAKVVNRMGYINGLAVFTITPAVLLLLMRVQSHWIITALELFIIGGCIIGGAHGVLYTYISTTYPNAFRGTGLGTASAFGRFGGSFGPAIGGLLIANHFAATSTFPVFAVPLIIAAIGGFISKQPAALAASQEAEAARAAARH